MSLVGLLITLVIIGVIIYIVRLILPMLGLPEPINTAVLLILGLIGLIWLLSQFGYGPNIPLTR